MKNKLLSIVKYNPAYRDANGAYQREEWTSYSDIGKEFSGKVLTLHEYLHVESCYVHAVKAVMDSFNSKKIKLLYVYKHSKKSDFRRKIDKDLYKTYNLLEEKQWINDFAIIAQIVKIALREYAQIEFLVDYKSRSSIIFGFDYYMYLKSSINNYDLKSEIERLGLFTGQ